MLESQETNSIFIVEDEALVARDIEVTLNSLGYRILGKAISGEQALAALDSQTLPDLILMDIVLAGELNGIETSVLIKEKYDIPVIFATAHSDKKTLEAAKITVPYGFIPKPINKQILLITIEMALYKHQTEKKLAEKEERYRNLIETMHEGMIIVDENAIIKFVNHGMLKISGYSEQELIGKSVFDLIKKSEHELLHEQLSKRRSGKTQSYELRITKKDGTEAVVSISPNPIFGEDGDFKGSMSVVADLTQRRDVEQKLIQSQIELRNLSRHIQSVKEDEARRIAREIHDDLGQNLTALRMDVSWFIQKLVPVLNSHAQVQVKVEAMVKLIDSIITSVQRISSELRPGLLDDLGLEPTIEWQTHEFEKRYNIPCKLNIEVADLQLEPGKITAIFRIFQEALINIARHSNATEVNIFLRKKKENEETLELVVSDNGCGITLEKIFSSRSVGLIGMRERLWPFQGKLIVTGEPGKGTTLIASVPL